MKKTIGLAILTLSSSVALANVSYYEVDVLESTPVYRRIEVESPVQQCWQEEVVSTSRGHERRSSTPTLLGAVFGGALGNAVGHHKSNKRVGTVVGAVLGASIARDITAHNRRPVVYHDTIEHCKTVYESTQEDKLVGYDVSYSYNGREYSVRMDQDPGATVRLRVDVEPVR
ncbi:MAG: glycine zipper 2TM domain-containing protein [Pseudomonadales bacterium]|nr:glycine zipper 2TM domain-containing protein [Pseudomonadales bacterium]